MWEFAATLNGHDPQLREDIVQEIMQDYLMAKLTLKDLENREIIRRYIHLQERLRQSKYRDVSIEQPLDGEEGSPTFADVLED